MKNTELYKALGMTTTATLAATNFKDKVDRSGLCCYLEHKYQHYIVNGVTFRDALEEYAEMFGGTVRKCPNKGEYIVTFKDNKETIKLRY